MKKKKKKKKKKRIIINSLGERNRKTIEGQGKTAYQIWTTLEKSFIL